MNNLYLSFGPTVFFLNCSIYSIHNFLSDILYKKCGLNNYEISLIQCLYVFKFLCAFFWSYICDLTGYHRTFLCITSIGYASAMIILVKLKDGLSVMHIIVFLVSLFFLSGIYLIRDSLILRILHIRGLSKGYGIVRIIGTLGNIFIHFLLGFSSSRFKEYGNNLNILFCFSSAILTAISVFCLVEPYPMSCKICQKLHSHRICPEKKILIGNKETRQSSSDCVNKEGKRLTIIEFIIEQAKKWLKIATFFWEIVNFELICLLCISLGFGIQRASLCNFLTRFLVSKNFEQHKIAYMYVYRGSVEIFFYFLIPYIQKKFNFNLILLCSLILGILRTSVYSFAPIKADNMNSHAFIYFIEFVKACSSSLYQYSMPMAIKAFATDETFTTVQGYANSCYQALANFVSGITGCFFFKKHRDSDPNIYSKFFGFNIIYGFIAIPPALYCILRQRKLNYI